MLEGGLTAGGADEGRCQRRVRPCHRVTKAKRKALAIPGPHQRCTHRRPSSIKGIVYRRTLPILQQCQWIERHAYRREERDCCLFWPPMMVSSSCRICWRTTAGIEPLTLRSSFLPCWLHVLTTTLDYSYLFYTDCSCRLHFSFQQATHCASAPIPSLLPSGAALACRAPSRPSLTSNLPVNARDTHYCVLRALVGKRRGPCCESRPRAWRLGDGDPLGSRGTLSVYCVDRRPDWTNVDSSLSTTNTLQDWQTQSFSVTMAAADIDLSAEAYSTIVLHCAKHPAAAITGLLLGPSSSNGKGRAVTGALPLQHHWNQLSPMVEVGCSLVSRRERV